MTAIDASPESGSLGIGELSRLSGVPVRTIRFYCDEGVLEAHRSTGNHRRFDASAVDQLGLVRRLRALGVGLPSITDVLAGNRSMEEAIAGERACLTGEIASLSWRHAALGALEQASPAERAARLSLLSTAAEGTAVRRMVSSFWRDLASGHTGAEAVHRFVDGCVPELPVEPLPQQVVAYAGLLALTADQSLKRELRNRARVSELVRDGGALMTGIQEACAKAMGPISEGRRPGPGEALDAYVLAHADAAGRSDTVEFRRELLAHVKPDRDPRLVRYWRLVDEIQAAPHPVTRAHCWLLDSLEQHVADVDTD